MNEARSMKPGRRTQLVFARIYTMQNDPIVAEARKAGQAYVDSFKGDLKAVFADLRRRTEEACRAGWRVVSLPLKRTKPKHRGGDNL
jgi:hypothetical protein